MSDDLDADMWSAREQLVTLINAMRLFMSLPDGEDETEAHMLSEIIGDIVNAGPRNAANVLTEAASFIAATIEAFAPNDGDRLMANLSLLVARKI